MKPCQKPITQRNDDSSSIHDLGSTCLPLSQIRGIAELFLPVLPGEGRELSSDACNGVFLTLQGAADEIQKIINNEIDIQKAHKIRCGEVDHGNI